LLRSNSELAFVVNHAIWTTHQMGPREWLEGPYLVHGPVSVPYVIMLSPLGVRQNSPLLAVIVLFCWFFVMNRKMKDKNVI